MTVAELIEQLQALPPNLPVRVQLDYLNLTEESYGAHDILKVYVPYDHAPCYLGVIYHEGAHNSKRQDSGCG